MPQRYVLRAAERVLEEILQFAGSLTLSLCHILQGLHLQLRGTWDMMLTNMGLIFVKGVRERPLQLGVHNQSMQGGYIQPGG